MLHEHDELAFEIGELLVARGEKVAVSETTAGGLISARMVSVAGASRWLESAILPYSGVHKFEALGIDRATAGAGGSVSPAWVIATAEGLLRMTGAAWAVAESGIAGPQSGRRSAKPAGSVAIAIIGPNGTATEEHVFPGSRVEVMEAIAQRVLEMLRERITVAPRPNQ